MKKLATIFFTFILLISTTNIVYAASSHNLSKKQSIKLVTDAHERYWNVSSGVMRNGTIEPYKTFTYKGLNYRYLQSNQFNTKKKFYTYLGKSFTNNAIDKYIKRYNYIEYNGKIAKPDADGGSALNWKKATAKLIYHRKNVRLYEYKIPLFDTSDYLKQKVTFYHYNGKWLINNMDDTK